MRMRIAAAFLCVFCFAVAACGGDDDTGTSLETFCERNSELDDINAELFAPPYDKTPEEVKALSSEAITVVAALEAAAPDEVQDAMAELVPFEAFNEVFEKNDWDVEASNEEIDVLIAGVDSEAVADYARFIDEICTSVSDTAG